MNKVSMRRGGWVPSLLLSWWTARWRFESQVPLRARQRCGTMKWGRDLSRFTQTTQPLPPSPPRGANSCLGFFFALCWHKSQVVDFTPDCKHCLLPLQKHEQSLSVCVLISQAFPGAQNWCDIVIWIVQKLRSPWLTKLPLVNKCTSKRGTTENKRVGRDRGSLDLYWTKKRVTTKSVVGLEVFQTDMMSSSGASVKISLP